MGTLLTRKQFLERTQRNTPESINERIRHETELSIARTLASGTGAIENRLNELDREWDTERTLQTMASTFVLTGLALGATVNRKWLIFPGLVAGFLLQHSIQGWCPPLPLIRALGVRTPDEIARERYALKTARGDFGHVHGSANARALLQAASRA